METDIIYNEDCLKCLSKIPDKSIDLIVIDPPYNIKKDSWDDIKNKSSSNSSNAKALSPNRN